MVIGWQLIRAYRKVCDKHNLASLHYYLLEYEIHTKSARPIMEEMLENMPITDRLFVSLPYSNQSKVQVTTPNTVLSGTLKASKIQRAVVGVGLNSARRIGLVCAIAAISLTTVARRTQNGDIGERQVVVEVTRNGGVEHTIRIRQLRR